MKKILVFKVNGETVVESHTDLTIEEIYNLKREISSDCECELDDVEFIIEEYETKLSDIDVTEDGLVCWTDCYLAPYDGLRLPFEIGSDEYLDAVIKGNLIDYLKFN